MSVLIIVESCNMVESIGAGIIGSSDIIVESEVVSVVELSPQAANIAEAKRTNNTFFIF